MLARGELPSTGKSSPPPNPPPHRETHAGLVVRPSLSPLPLHIHLMGIRPGRFPLGEPLPRVQLAHCSSPRCLSPRVIFPLLPCGAYPHVAGPASLIFIPPKHIVCKLPVCLLLSVCSACFTPPSDRTHLASCLSVCVAVCLFSACYCLCPSATPGETHPRSRMQRSLQCSLSPLAVGQTITTKQTHGTIRASLRATQSMPSAPSATPRASERDPRAPRRAPSRRACCGRDLPAAAAR